MAVALTYNQRYGFVGKLFTSTPNLGNQNPFNFQSGTLPDGITVNNTTGVIFGTPTAFSETSQFSINYEDDNGPGTAVGYVYIIQLEYPSGYYIGGLPITIPTYIGGTAYVLNNNNYSNVSLPAGLSIDSGTGAISGSITTEIANGALYNIKVTTADTQEYTFTISLYRMYAWYSPSYNVYTNQNASFGPDASLDTISTFYVAIESPNQLPDGLSINGTTGVISGTPTETGEFVIQIMFGSGSYTSYATTITIVSMTGECLRGDAKVLTSNGYKPISMLTTDDYVITENKNIIKIKNIFTTPFVGNLYYIKKNSLAPYVPLNDVYLSANHLYKHNNKMHRPRIRLPRTIITEPITLYHVGLENEDENIIVEGIPMESHSDKSEL